LRNVSDEAALAAKNQAPKVDESAAAAWRAGLVPLHSSSRLAWDVVGMLAVFCSAGMLLFTSILTHRCQQDVLCNAQDEDTYLALLRRLAVTVEYAASVFFAFDMIVNLRTTYFEADGTEVVDPRRCAIRYASTWLAFDLLCVLPLGEILSFIDPPVDMKKDELTGMRKLLQTSSRVKSWWATVRKTKTFKIGKGVFSTAKSAPKIVAHQQTIAAVGLSRLLRVIRLLSKLKILKTISLVVRESKFVISFIKRISRSERAVRMAVAMYKIRKQHRYVHDEVSAAELIQARMRGKLARRFALRVQERISLRQSGHSKGRTHS
jgi:hypothetical protein